MKGVFLVIMMIGLLIVAVLVVKNVSTHTNLKGRKAQIQSIDRAKEAAEIMNQQTDEMQKKLDRVFQE